MGYEPYMLEVLLAVVTSKNLVPAFAMDVENMSRSGFFPEWPLLWLKTDVFTYVTTALFYRINRGKNISEVQFRHVKVKTLEALARVVCEIMW